MKYKFIQDLTSDVMFEAYGKDLKELFESAALALFDVFCDLKKVEAKDKVLVEVDGGSKEELIKNWLSELIALVDIEEKFFSKFNILEVGEMHLKAEVYGEDVSHDKGGTVVKAVTNYGFEMGEKDGLLFVRISLDI